MVLLKEVKEVKSTVQGKLFQTLTIRWLKNCERQLVEQGVNKQTNDIWLEITTKHITVSILQLFTTVWRSSKYSLLLKCVKKLNKNNFSAVSHALVEGVNLTMNMDVDARIRVLWCIINYLHRITKWNTKPSFQVILVPTLRLRFSGVFPLTMCAIQIYLLTYLLTIIRCEIGCRSSMHINWCHLLFFV